MKMYPYPDRRRWLVASMHEAEALPPGWSAVIERLVATKAIRDAEKGVRLEYRDEPFDGYDAVLNLVRKGADSGDVYRGVVMGLVMEVAALPFRLPVGALKAIYLKVSPLPPQADARPGRGLGPAWWDHDDSLFLTLTGGVPCRTAC